MRGPYTPGTDQFGMLAVMCWCGRRVVHVLPKVVQAGLTGSCGRAHCKQPGAPNGSD